MENKTLYCIVGYIPSDENKVVINVYQQLRMGNGDENGYKYCWSAITNGSGVGFGLSFGSGAFEDTTEDSIIEFLKVVREENMVLDKMTFEEMVEKYNIMKENLSKRLEVQEN